MYERHKFTRNVSLLPCYYDENIDTHLLQVLKNDFEGKIYDGHLIVEVLALGSELKDIYRHHYIMDGVTHLTVTFECVTEALYENEMIEMTKIDTNTFGSFWQTASGYLQSFTLDHHDNRQIGETALIQIIAKAKNSFTLGKVI